jgi:hypothetical protein
MSWVTLFDLFTVLYSITPFHFVSYIFQRLHLIFTFRFNLLIRVCRFFIDMDLSREILLLRRDVDYPGLYRTAGIGTGAGVRPGQAFRQYRQGMAIACVVERYLRSGDSWRYRRCHEHSHEKSQNHPPPDSAVYLKCHYLCVSSCLV